MTSAELKHRAKLQEWAARIQDCRSSGLSVRAWCRQEEINASTYYRWERELLTAADQAPCSGVPAVTFAELPEPKKMSRNVSERCATLRIGSASLDIYSGYDAKQPKNVSGYSSPMLNDFTGTDKVYIVRGYTYLHKGIDGPAWLTYQQFELDSFTNMLFLFCGRHRGHIKGLYLEKDGIIMLYKRLGQGVVPVDAFGI